MTFARPELAWLAVALPLLVCVAVYGYARRRRRVAAALGDPVLISRLGGPGFDPFPARRAAALAAAAAALGLAATGPQWGLRPVEGRVTSQDIVLVLDVSRSMLVSDVVPSRLERQRLLARQLLRELEGSRIGLVAFAGRAYILSPLTVDRSALELYLDALDTEIASEGGSALAAAIRQGTDLAMQGAGERGGARSMILISDGEAHDEENEIMAAVARARRAGVTVHTVTVGTEQGGPVPELDDWGGIRSYVRYEGEVVISRSNPELMERIASETGGTAQRLDRPGAAAAIAAAARGRTEATVIGEQGYEPVDRFRWFAAAALVLLAIDAVVARRVLPRPVRREA